MTLVVGYSKPLYQGENLSLQVDKYQELPMSLSSLVIPNGLLVYTYPKTNFRGKEEVYGTNVSKLFSSAKSLKVVKDTTENDTIKIRYSSNSRVLSGNGYPEHAELSSHSAWHGSGSRNEYLQLDLPYIYNVTEILIRGRRDKDEWVKKFKVFYKDLENNTPKWTLLGELPGNSNQEEIVKNHVTILTNSIRIYPTSWFKKPSMRIGLVGNKAKLRICPTTMANTCPKCLPCPVPRTVKYVCKKCGEEETKKLR